jgi:hypothetical protein
MTNRRIIPETPVDYDETRLIERPDGFYWQRKADGAEYGPFATLVEALRDMQYGGADSDEDADDLGEVLDPGDPDLGVADWVDEESGEFDEGALGLDER